MDENVIAQVLFSKWLQAQKKEFPLNTELSKQIESIFDELDLNHKFNELFSIHN